AAQSWELTALGDSFAWLTGWPTQYADMASAEFGVGISVNGDVCLGGCRPDSLTRVRDSEDLQGLIANAEIIVLQPQLGRVVAPQWTSYFDGECAGEDGLGCFRQAEAEFRIYVEEFFDEVIALSQPGAVIRTTVAGSWAIDAFHPGLRDTDPETFEALLENILILGDQVAEAAANRCILTVDVSTLFSGPDYRQPIKPEYSNDGSHPSQEGSRVIAESLHSLGYESTMGGCS
ncbi:MAG: hypothetical protein V3V82_05550, partial [Acidimicrobiia bacterium]